MAESPQERAKRILAERKAKDPLQWFSPTPTQEQFLRRDIKDCYSLISSVNRGGKSTIACVDLAWTLRGIHPYRPNYKGLTIIQFTPSRLQAANVIGAKLFKKSELYLPNAPASIKNEPMIPAWEIEKLNEPNVAGMKVPYELIMKNGNRLLFSWSGVEGIAKRIAGLRLDAAYVDEDAGTVALFDEVYPRLLDAQSDSSRPGLGYFVWPCTNVNYNEAHESFVERADRGVAGHKVYVIGKNENPAIDLNKREALKDVLSADAARIRMEGDLTAGELVSVYGKQWQDERHILPYEYQITPSDNIWISYDPGVDHPMGMGAFAINKEMPLRLHACKMWNYRGETIERDANNLQEWLQGRKLTGFVYDTNLKNKDRGGGPSVLERFKELLAARGIVPMAGFWQSKKNHAPGIAMTRHYLDPNPDDRTVPTLLVLSKPTDANGTGMLRQQLLKYRGKESTKFTGAGGVVKKDDELVDLLRYLIMNRPSHNPDWACGGPMHISTQRVALLDATGTIPQVPVAMESSSAQRFNFSERRFITRRRDAARSSWSEASC